VNLLPQRTLRAGLAHALLTFSEPGIDFRAALPMPAVMWPSGCAGTARLCNTRCESGWPPESSAVEQVSSEVGVSVTTLERWRAEALADGSASSNQRWTPVARLQAVIATATLDEVTRGAWCRVQGIYPAELEAWKQDAVAGLGEPRAASATTM
jgi:hypothetical protein